MSAVNERKRPGAVRHRAANNLDANRDSPRGRFWQAESGEAELVAHALRGRRSGSGWLCRCPAHLDKSPSLSIGTGHDGRFVAHCFSGCSFADIRAALVRDGILEDQRPDRHAPRYRSPPIALADPEPEPERPFPDAAARLWERCRPIMLGTVAARYLTLRGCALPDPDADLRWTPLRHPDGYTGPAMVGLVTDAVTAEPMTLHRTWLAPDGSGKALIDRPRLLWPNGRKKGGVIRLVSDDEITLGLAIAEGIESALAAARVFPAIWSTVDAGNLADFPILGGVECLTIFGDRDPAGIAAAVQCAERWRAADREVEIFVPSSDGQDVNDWIRL